MAKVKTDARIIYVPNTWVESLKMRLECLDKSFGPIRGITIESYHDYQDHENY